MAAFKKNKQYYSNSTWAVKNVREEMDAGLKLLKKIDNKIVTVFGGHKVVEGDYYYEHCKKVAFELGKRGYAIMTGGGSGIMEAANAGAMKAGALSVGLKAKLLKDEWVKDDIFTYQMAFHFLFVRRFILSIKSDALIFYPGGFGTLNELFEFATLMKTGISDQVPIICVNKKFWKGMFKWLKDKPLKEGLLNKKDEDLKLLYLTDDLDEILKIIENK